MSREAVIGLLLRSLADELVRHDTEWSRDPYSRRVAEHRGAAQAYRAALYYLLDDADHDEIDARAERLWPERMDHYIEILERGLPNLVPEDVPFRQAEIAAARTLARTPGRPAGAKRVA